MKLHNTKTKFIQELVPLEKNKVKLYVCGPTVYASPHLGNARSAVVYDLLFRVLKTKYEVEYVRNITDVDDKINAAAKASGKAISDITEAVTHEFNEVMQKLGCLTPTFEPKVTQHIPDIIAVIEKLIQNGNAYVAEKHVLFDVKSDANYGSLSRRSVDEMIAGARVEVAPYKKNAGDFVLWKPASENDDASSVFASPWGQGRPGWHIECTAMATKYLGQDFDIHGGGADLTFPHHENEIAQATCAHKGSIYANIWVHNGFLTVNGEKMSKSLGNFIVTKDLLEKVNGDVIRWALLSSHYRSPLDWTEKLLSDAKKTVDRFYRLPDLDKAVSEPDKEMLEFLYDDIEFSMVRAYLWGLSDIYYKDPDNKEVLTALRNNLKFLGFYNYTADEYFGRAGVDDEVEKLINLRKAAKDAKNYAEADKIRQQLLDMGIVIEDKAGGITEWRKL